LDQNVPRVAVAWLTQRLPGWDILHVFELGLGTATDAVIGEVAAEHHAIVLTFDEDFLDQRAELRSKLAGVIRLRIWPTRLENVLEALQRLLDEVPAAEFQGRAIVVDRRRIRVRAL
jgi:predicted nuclease of predicted toxin-antitoxin system